MEGNARAQAGLLLWSALRNRDETVCLTRRYPLRTSAAADRAVNGWTAISPVGARSHLESENSDRYKTLNQFRRSEKFQPCFRMTPGMID